MTPADPAVPAAGSPAAGADATGRIVPDAPSPDARTEVLRRILVTHHGEPGHFDRLSRLAGRMIGTPTALVAFLDPAGCHVAGAMGPTGPVALSRCAGVVRAGVPHVVCDTEPEPEPGSRSGSRSGPGKPDGSPDTGGEQVAAFLGVPVVMAGPDGVRQVVGALAVGDTEPRDWTAQDVTAANDLAALVSEQVELQVIAEEGRQALAAAHATAVAESAAKSRFIAAVNHELRTPLAGLLGMLELLGGQPLNDRASELLGLATSAGRHLLALIGDVLDVGKLQSGTVDLEHRVVEPARLADEAVALVRHSIGDAVELETVVPSSVPPALLGDPLRLRQILVNLLSNAARFTTGGTITVSVRTLADTDQGGNREIAGLGADAAPATGGDSVGLVWTVRDTGVGMTDEEVARVFAPYAQASRATARLHGGTGLGLTIVRELAGLMGGSVSVDSAPGRGTAISVTTQLELPDGPVEADPVDQDGAGADPTGQDDGAGTDEAGPGTPRPAGARRGRVLLAEDYEINALVAAATLQKLGFTVDVVADGAAALAALTGGAGPDLAGPPYVAVLMDCQMPIMDGYTATEELRRWEAADAARGHTRVVALTANAVSGERDRCHAAGMDDYLTKPFRAEELGAVLVEPGGPTEPDPPGPDRPADDGGPVDRARPVAVPAPATPDVEPGTVARLATLLPGDEPDRLRAVITSFTGRDGLAALRAAIDIGGCRAVVAAAAGYRRTAVTYGLTAAVAELDKLEIAAAAGDQAGCAARLPALEAADRRGRRGLATQFAEVVDTPETAGSRG